MQSQAKQGEIQMSDVQLHSEKNGEIIFPFGEEEITIQSGQNSISKEDFELLNKDSSFQAYLKNKTFTLGDNSQTSAFQQEVESRLEAEKNLKEAEEKLKIGSLKEAELKKNLKELEKNLKELEKKLKKKSKEDITGFKSLETVQQEQGTKENGNT